MKRARFFPIALVLFLVLSAVGPSAAPPRVVVLSYNIRHGEGMDKQIRLDRIAAVIRSVSPDVVALQEVDCKAQRSGGVDQAGELARLTGMRAAFGRTMDFQGGQYGNAVLTRLTIATSATRALPFSKGREPRAVLMVDLAWPTSGPAEQASAAFSLFATHFDFTPDDKDRLAASFVISRWVAENSDHPTLMAGDLNSTPGSVTLLALGSLWQAAGAGRIFPTVPSGRPRNQIDYVLLRPAARWKVVEVRVLDEPMASDHRPILAVLELLPPRKEP